MTAEENKPQEPEKRPAENAGAPGTYSLDDLDQILQQEDPSFSESLQAIKKEHMEDTSSIEGLSVEGGDDDTGESSDSEVEDVPMRGKVRMFFKRPYLRLLAFLKLRMVALRNRVVLFKGQAVEFLRHGLPDRLRYYRSQAKAFFLAAYAAWLRFKARPRQQKIGICLIGLCMVGALYFLHLTFVSRWMPSLRQNFVADLSRHGVALGRVKEASDMLPMADAFPEVEFQVRLEKVIVNLRRGPDESGLPMGVFEFFLGVDARDTAVEIRDREKQMLDLVQRTLEGFTYDEIMSYAGKVRAKARIRDNINSALNQGEVKRVYIHSMITNH